MNKLDLIKINRTFTPNERYYFFAVLFLIITTKIGNACLLHTHTHTNTNTHMIHLVEQQKQIHHTKCSFITPTHATITKHSEDEKTNHILHTALLAKNNDVYLFNGFRCKWTWWKKNRNKLCPQIGTRFRFRGKKCVWNIFIYFFLPSGKKSWEILSMAHQVVSSIVDLLCVELQCAPHLQGRKRATKKERQGRKLENKHSRRLWHQALLYHHHITIKSKQNNNNSSSRHRTGSGENKTLTHNWLSLILR